MIREFENQDVNDVIDLAESHCRENGSGFGLFHEAELIKLIKKIKVAEDWHGIVYTEGDRVYGYAACQIQWNPWNRYKEGIIQYFYIHPSKRNGFLSKSLFNACEQWFEKQVCDYFMASTMAFDENFEVNDQNDEFLEQADGFFGRMMTPAGSYYVKGVK